MSFRLSDVPGWVKLILTLAGILVSVTLAYANLRSENVRIEGKLDKEVELRQQENTYINKNLEDIKQMLREELASHRD